MAIPIKYVNSTGKTDFQVLVFTKNFSVNTPETYYAAWMVLRAQTQADFTYPKEIQVGATYEQGGQNILSGPFDANPGSTWSITQKTPSDTAVLAESELNFFEKMQPITREVRKSSLAILCEF